MFKKTRFFLIISIFSSVASNQASHEIVTLKNQLTHIAEQKASIIVELKKTMTMGKKAIEHHKASLGESYQPLAQQIGTVLNNIIISQEFYDTLEHITNYQTEQIVEYGTSFLDITYENLNWDYSIHSKISTELLTGFSLLDDQIEQLFNIFYIIIANYRGGTMLVKKLTDKEVVLTEKLRILSHSNELSDDNIAKQLTDCQQA